MFAHVTVHKTLEIMRHLFDRQVFYFVLKNDHHKRWNIFIFLSYWNWEHVPVMEGVVHYALLIHFTSVVWHVSPPSLPLETGILWEPSDVFPLSGLDLLDCPFTFFCLSDIPSPTYISMF